MLCSKTEIALYLLELVGADLTYRTNLRSCLTLVNITAYCTYPFCHNHILLFKKL